MDDGSSDGSADLVEAEQRPDVLVHRQRPQGVSRARNVGLELARAPVVSFLDADDEWTPGTTTAQLVALRGAAEAVYGDCLLVNERHGSSLRLSSRIPQPEQPQLVDLLRHRPVPLSTVAARRAVLLREGGFDEGLKSCEDYDLWYRLLLRGVRLRRITRVLALIHVRPDGLSSDLEQYRRSMGRILDRMLEDGRLSREERTVVLDQRRRLSAAVFPAHEPDRSPS